MIQLVETDNDKPSVIPERVATHLCKALNAIASPSVTFP